MHAAVMGLGEAGTLYARGLVASGWSVAGFDPADTPTPPGVERATDASEAVRAADVVLSLVGGSVAVDAARSFARALDKGAVVLDMNSASPHIKERVAELVGHERYADVGVVGSVPEAGAATSVVVSGAASSRAAEVFSALGAPVEDIAGEPGDAARRKLLRSSFMKGIGALIVETLDAGEAMGAREWALAQLSGEVSGGGESVQRLYAGTRKHARRRGIEADESAEMLDALGLDAGMARAAARTHRLLADDAIESRDSLLRTAIDVPVANIGDARERMGMAAGAIAPLWPGARAVGWARTVWVAAGDNVALHEAIERARPGEMLVVDGQGFTDRAVLGELMAAKAMKRGVVGIVVDGALRDRRDLEEMGFPAWARGTSPAGPYKNGPGGSGVAVSVGGVVVHQGDLVAADDDGVIVVPRDEAACAVHAALEIGRDEARRRRVIAEEDDA